MTAFQPGFADETFPEPPAPPPPRVETAVKEPEPLSPGFMESASEPPSLPTTFPMALPPPSSPGPGPLGLVGAGLGVLVVGGSALSLLGFVNDQMARSPTLGWISLGVVSAGFAAILAGVTREIGAWRRLSRVDTLRSMLRPPGGGVPGGDIRAARAACAEWLRTVAPKLRDAEAARLALNGCETVEELRAMLAHHAVEPLREQALALGSRAAFQGAALVAIIPSPALEGLAAGLRSLSLIREVAALHGLRPGLTVTLGLLRRAAMTAAGVYGTNEIATAAAAHFLADTPVLRSLASAAPGAGITARRIWLLSRAVAEACSPV